MTGPNPAPTRFVAEARVRRRDRVRGFIAGEEQVPRRMRNGKWQAVWRVPGPENEWRQKTKVFKGKREASRYEQEMKLKYKSSSYNGDCREKLGVYLRRWVEVSGPYLEPSTRYAYQNRIERYIVPRLGVIRLDKLSPRHIEDFYLDLLTQPSERGKPLSSTTVRGIHTVLNMALNEAVLRGDIETNPTRRIPRSSLPKARSAQGSCLTEDQMRSLLTTTRETNLGAMYLLAVTVGMRLGELIALKWSHIDFERRILHVLESRKPIGYLGKPKGKEPRDIPLPDVMIQELLHHKTLVDQQRLKAKTWEEQDLVFPGVAGGYRSTSGVEDTFKRHIKKAGLPTTFRFHDLRHTAATRLVATGGDIVSIARILGHKDPSITLRIYAHGTGHEREIMEMAQRRLMGDA